jgi:hypothetical protein
MESRYGIHEGGAFPVLWVLSTNGIPILLVTTATNVLLPFGFLEQARGTNPGIRSKERCDPQIQYEHNTLATFKS